MASKNGNKAPSLNEWIVAIVLLFVFPPIGILMLIGRLIEAGKAESNNSSRYKTNSNKTVYVVPQNDWQKQYEVGRRNEIVDVETAFESAAAEAAKLGGISETTAAKKAEPVKKAEPAKKTGGRKRAPKTALEREMASFKGINALLITAMLFGFLTAIPCAAVGIPHLVMGYPSCIPLLIVSAVFGTGGLLSLFARNTLAKRVKLRKRYLKVVGETKSIEIAAIARSIGRSESQVRRELEAMIDDGYFGENAYLDMGLDALVLDADIARMAQEGAEEVVAAPEIPISEYDRILRELRTLDEKIEDEEISDKIMRIGVTCARIFETVKDNPEKLPQLRRFMNYYLPTTLKLLRAYVTLEKQGIQGENIGAARENINRVLGTLADGFDRQLDQLFRTDVIDIGADIEVLESMLASDGLASESPFRTAEESAAAPVIEAEAPPSLADSPFRSTESPFAQQTSTGEIV